MDNTKTNGRTHRPVAHWIIHLGLAALFLALGIGFAVYLLKTPLRAKRQAVEKVAQRVAVYEVRRGPTSVRIDLMGLVKPSREITLMPEVSGVIEEVCPEWMPGGFVRKGQTLVRIDPRDYQVAVKLRQSELAAAQLALTLEQAAQKVARSEYELLGDIVDSHERSLVLREPHLQKAQEAVAGAQAALEKALLDVQRCQLSAPFDAVIGNKFADVGARVSAGMALATLMATDLFWVEAQVPVDQVPWIEISPDRANASIASIFLGEQYLCEGWVSSLQGQLEPSGRMAQILISVPDPLGLNRSLPVPLFAGSYVRVVVEGKRLENVVELPRALLRQGQAVWIADPQNILRIIPVRVVVGLRQIVYIDQGLEDGQRVIATFLPTAVEGMPITIVDYLDWQRANALGDQLR